MAIVDLWEVSLDHGARQSFQGINNKEQMLIFFDKETLASDQCRGYHL